MNKFTQSIKNIFTDTSKAFLRYPVSISSVGIISLIAMIRINLGYNIDHDSKVILDIIQVSLMFLAIFSQAVVVYSDNKDEDRSRTLKNGNIIGLLITIVTILLLYFFGIKDSSSGIFNLKNIAIARVIAISLVSAIAVVYIISKAKTIKSFSKAFYITNKALFISMFYAFVMFLGVFTVVEAFRSLVYPSLSVNTFQYLAVIIGFITYTIFLSYFPNFNVALDLENSKYDLDQPQFIKVLLGYILVPIMLALTVVLLIWSGQVMFLGLVTTFETLASISTTYVLFGIWLYIMIADHKTKVASFYKLAYPISALLVLALEAWALFDQVTTYGFMTVEYSFAMIWIFAAISIVLILTLKDQAYKNIALAAAVITILWVLPFIGYQDVTFNSQVSLLEKELVKNSMLDNNEIKKSSEKINVESKYIITRSTNFIIQSEKDKYPIWFNDKLDNSKVFLDTFGFSEVYQPNVDNNQYNYYTFIANETIIDISDYDLAVNINDSLYRDQPTTFTYNNQEYSLKLDLDEKDFLVISIYKGENQIIDENLKVFLDRLINTYALGSYEIMVPVSDMTYKLVSDDLEVMLVFETIGFSQNKNSPQTDYIVNLSNAYLKFK